MAGVPRGSGGDGVRLAEVLAAVSLATDVGRGFPPETALRTCLVAMRIAEELGLDAGARRSAFYAALVHATGCTGFTWETARLGMDEHRMIPAFTGADAANPAEQLRAVARAAAGNGLRRQARAAIRSLTTGPRLDLYVARADCDAGGAFARRVGLGEPVIRAVVQVRERWDGRGLPSGIAGERIDPAARVVGVAGQVELFARTRGPVDVRAMLRRRSGGWFDPAIVAAFERRAGETLDELGHGSVWDAVLSAEPEPAVTIPPRRLDDLAGALAGFVDVKSPWLLGHSAGVAERAAAAGRVLGRSSTEIDVLRRAALVHDLGRVGVSNLIWDRPGPLTRAEWEQIRLHPYTTERVLAHARPMAPFAAIAGLHHERSDGSGYHRGATVAALPMTGRLLAAADVFQACTEPRPHRPARTPEDAAREVSRMASAGLLDPDASRAVCEAAGTAGPRRRRAAWPAGLTDREVEVLRHLARGRSKREIAAVLVISVGTVHTHTGHIYEKTGVSTRAGVALFAMEHGLVEN